MLAPGRRGLPGGDAVGQPARGRRRAGDARAARRARLRAPGGAHRAARRRACARRRGGRYPVQVASAPGPADGVLQRAPGRARFEDAPRMRPGRPRGVVPGAALARGLPAAVAVRGVVPVAGAHRRADRAHASRPRRAAFARPAAAGAGERDRQRALGWLERLRALLREEGGLMATLLVRRADARPASEARAAPRGSPPRARAPRAGARSTSCWWRRSTRATCCTTAHPRVVRAAEADLGLLAGDRLYAIGLARLVALGDTRAVAELADTITLSALAQGAGEPAAGRGGLGAPARAPSAGDPSEAHRRAKELALRRAPRRRSRRCAQAPRALPASP